MGFRNTITKMDLCFWAQCVVADGGSMRRSSSWASRAVVELCATFAVQRLQVWRSCAFPPSLLHPRVLAQLPFSLGRWAVGMGTPGSSWGEMSSCRIQGEFSSWQQTQHLQSHLCSCAGVMLARRVPNEHWKMAHLHCWVFQQTKENLIISSWLAGSKFCWAVRKESEGPYYLKKPMLYLPEAALLWHHCSLGCRSRGCRQILEVAGSQGEKTLSNSQLWRGNRDELCHPALACAALSALTEQLIHSLAVTCILWKNYRSCDALQHQAQ